METSSAAVQTSRLDAILLVTDFSATLHPHIQDANALGSARASKKRAQCAHQRCLTWQWCQDFSQDRRASCPHPCRAMSAASFHGPPRARRTGRHRYCLAVDVNHAFTMPTALFTMLCLQEAQTLLYIVPRVDRVLIAVMVASWGAEGLSPGCGSPALACRQAVSCLSG